MTSKTVTKLPLAPGKWELDPSHSNIGFAIRHLGVSKVRGRFAQLEGSLQIAENSGDHSVAATVGLGSIDTGNADRDTHIRGADFLNVEKRPTMTFRSTRVRITNDDGEQGQLDGELTIGGVTQPITFDVEFGGVQTSVVDGLPHAGFEATGQLRRRDFGLHFGAGEAVLGDRIAIELDVQFIEPQHT
ncbi:YceI family protein [Nesterenkonia ebinurensis]|uniref:YceI family protein n=1 Tax=Nesterenkonia ebinurensis TaxID=2608252 RepID=UPI00123DF067|nr:YceI family protein [Nesterenkonia ebinurensis]